MLQIETPSKSTTICIQAGICNMNDNIILRQSCLPPINLILHVFMTLLLLKIIIMLQIGYVLQVLVFLLAVPALPVAR